MLDRIALLLVALAVGEGSEHAAARAILETERFALHGPPELVERYAALLELHADRLAGRLGLAEDAGDARAASPRARIELLGSRAAWEAREPELARAGVLGSFDRRSGVVRTYHDGEDPERTAWVLRHELCHLLLHRASPRARPAAWLDEGLADHLAAPEGPAERRVALREVLAEEPRPSLAALLALEPGAFDERAAALAWALVRFLDRDPELGPGFARFLADGGAAAPSSGTRERLLPALGLANVEELAAPWHAWLHRITSEPLTDARGLLVRAARRLARGQDEGALADAEAALAAGSRSAAARWTRGLLRLAAGRRVDGILDLERSVELAPRAPRYRFALGVARAGLAPPRSGPPRVRGPIPPATSAEDLAAAEVELATAAALAPEDDDYAGELAELRRLAGRP